MRMPLWMCVRWSNVHWVDDTHSCISARDRLALSVAMVTKNALTTHTHKLAIDKHKHSLAVCTLFSIRSYCDDDVYDRPNTIVWNCRCPLSVRHVMLTSYYTNIYVYIQHKTPSLLIYATCDIFHNIYGRASSFYSMRQTIVHANEADNGRTISCHI